MSHTTFTLNQISQPSASKLQSKLKEHWSNMPAHTCIGKTSSVESYLKGMIEVEDVARLLTLEEEEMLKRQNDRLVPEFKQINLEKEAAKNWDLFYKRNTTKFFKDRHLTAREFKELDNEKICSKRILEVGCGVGNFIFSLLEETKDTYFYACDFSPRAIQFVKENPLYDSKKCHAFCCDLTEDKLKENVPDLVDIVSLVFVLSAIHPDKMVSALCNICSVLRPDGCVLFRDYGVNDYAMLRFKAEHKLQDHLYVRQDNTRAYYFSTGLFRIHSKRLVPKAGKDEGGIFQNAVHRDVCKLALSIGWSYWEASIYYVHTEGRVRQNREAAQELFTEAGFCAAKLEYVHREMVNHKEQLSVPRVFLQAKFLKPVEDYSS